MKNIKNIVTKGAIGLNIVYMATIMGFFVYDVDFFKSPETDLAMFIFAPCFLTAVASMIFTIVGFKRPWGFFVAAFIFPMSIFWMFMFKLTFGIVISIVTTVVLAMAAFITEEYDINYAKPTQTN